MMEQTMAKSRSKADRLIRNSFLVGLALGGFVGLSRKLGYMPSLDALSPTAAIATCALASTTLIGFTIWFIRATDEHDRLAHFWSMTWAYLILSATVFSCWLLEKNGVIAPVDPIYQLFGSLVIGSAIWIWMRFR
jgi:hypothetical protein